MWVGSYISVRNQSHTLGLKQKVWVPSHGHYDYEEGHEEHAEEESGFNSYYELWFEENKSCIIRSIEARDTEERIIIYNIDYDKGYSADKPLFSKNPKIKKGPLPGNKLTRKSYTHPSILYKMHHQPGYHLSEDDFDVKEGIKNVDGNDTKNK